MHSFKLAFRQLLRHKSYTIINILGLSFGMTCTLYILLWIFGELSFDNFHHNKETLFEIFWYKKGSDGKPFISQGLPSPVTSAILKEIPEVIAATRLLSPERVVLKYKEKSFFTNGYYADTSFFTIFSYSLIKGIPTQVLKDPNSIVISESIVEKYFQGQDPVGKFLIFANNNRSYKVTGVIKNVPANSTKQFDFIVPIESYLNGKPWLQDWGNYCCEVFIKTAPHTSIETVNSKIKQILQKNSSVKFELFIYPYINLHLGSGLNYKDYHSNGNIWLLKLFIAVAILILIIACLNFMNLSLATSLGRSCEVGVKKIVGSNNMKLVYQFFIESLGVSILALIFSLLLIKSSIFWFNQIFLSNISLTIFNSKFIFCCISICLLSALITGIYPVLFLTSFKPILLLKRFNNNKGKNLRHILIVFQFAGSITLIICAVFINKQMHFIQNKTIGFNNENIITFQTYSGIGKKPQLFKSELLKIRGVESATFSSQNIVNVQQLTQDFKWPGKAVTDDRWFALINTDFDFINTFKLDLIKGRNFSSLFSDTTNTCIINETASKIIGFEDPIGKPVYFWKDKGKIIGVIKDFHLNDLFQQIRPLVIRIAPEYLNSLFVCINPIDKVSIIKNIRQLYLKYETDYPFEYKFEQEIIKDMYNDSVFFESRISGIFSFLSISIACMGLFCLTAFELNLRTKEIGIRKINGSSIYEIILFLYKDYIKILILSFIIAFPISWYLVNYWMQSFAYKTELSWGVFLATGGIVLLIALLTVTWHGWRVATRNPVDALRCE